jgi:AcrR family transcriptional regulator
MPFSSVSSGSAAPRTPKGRRGAERLIEAATVVLARDGYGGASIGRITDEAGVPKRMVAYYFGTRQALLACVVQRLTAGIASEISAGAAGAPDDATAAWVDAVWAGVTATPGLARAYIALLGGDRDGETSDALAEVERTFLALVDGLVRDTERAGGQLVVERDAFGLMAFALLRGLTHHWVESGDTPALAESLRQTKRLLAGAFSGA